MIDTAALVHRWSSLTADAPMPKLSRTRIIGSRMMISRVVLEEGCFVPEHSHANEQFACILEGALKFVLGSEGQSNQREVTVRAGEVLHLPSNLPHSALALERTIVLDLFSPPSQTTGIDVHNRD